MIDEIRSYLSKSYREKAETARQVAFYFAMHPDEAANDGNFVLLDGLYNATPIGAKKILNSVFIDAINARGYYGREITPYLVRPSLPEREEGRMEVH